MSEMLTPLEMFEGWSEAVAELNGLPATDEITSRLEAARALRDQYAREASRALHRKISSLLVDVWRANPSFTVRDLERSANVQLTHNNVRALASLLSEARSALSLAKSAAEYRAFCARR